MSTRYDKGQGLRVRRGARDRRIRGVALHCSERLRGRPLTLEIFALLKHHCMDVPLEMIHCNQRQTLRKRQGLGICDAHKQRARQARTAGYRNGVEIGQRNACLGQRRAHHGHNRTQMLAAGELRHHASIFGMGGNLRRDHGRQRACATLHDGGSGFVAGGFDT